MGCSRRRLGCAASLRADVSASRFSEDCPRAHSLGPALRDPFSSTATIERAKETRAVQTRKPVRQTKAFLAASTDGSLVPSFALAAEVRSQELENPGNVGNAPTERYPRDKVSKLDSGNIQQSLHSAVGNFLSLLGIPQYADQFMDLGLENLVTLSRLSDEGLVKETEKISFLPGHRARLLRGVLVLREASLIRVREQASKTREKALLTCLAERNQDLAQEVSQLDLKVKTLQAQNVDYAQQLNHFRSQAAELEVKAKTQAKQVRFLTEKLEEHLTGRTFESVGDDAAAISRQRITGVPAFAVETGFDAKARTETSSCGQHPQQQSRVIEILGVHREERESFEKVTEKDQTKQRDWLKDFTESAETKPSALGSSFANSTDLSFGLNYEPAPVTAPVAPVAPVPPAEPVEVASLTFEGIACCCASFIQKMMSCDTGDFNDEVLWTPGPESGLGSPGRFEIAEFLIETSRKEPAESLSFPRFPSFLPVAVLLVIYLHRICRISSSSPGSSLSSSQSSQPSLPVTERNWQRLLFTLLRRAEKEHFHLTEPDECSDLYSKEEIHDFDKVVHDHLVDWSVSRKDAVAALDILGFSLPVEDLHLSFES